MSKLLANRIFSARVSKAGRLPVIALRYKSNKFGEYTPSPPKLPREQQEEFEALQKLANSQAAIDEYNRQIREEGAASSDISTSSSDTDVGVTTQYFKTIPEFEGERNPVTGEIGGPKQDPLKHNDWSFNGRVTDF
ncbi:hypothetical protein JCM33374_g2134 [Metschnikowia sp. JCM 33374]|nr:hypothetical protein JCM33374_g2134 [Metschnikowia sp. JCM 33374]